MRVTLAAVISRPKDLLSASGSSGLPLGRENTSAQGSRPMPTGAVLQDAPHIVRASFDDHARQANCSKARPCFRRLELELTLHPFEGLN